AKTTPAQRPTLEVVSCLPSTTTPAAAAPIISELGSRDHPSLTVLFLAAVHRHRPGLWIFYSAGLAVTAVANVFTVLVLAAHV
ncbi:hypothetical protein C6A85_15250, partial [Mycobacterium sp. ITM-2017-0098]